MNDNFEDLHNTSIERNDSFIELRAKVHSLSAQTEETKKKIDQVYWWIIGTLASSVLTLVGIVASLLK